MHTLRNAPIIWLVSQLPLDETLKSLNCKGLQHEVLRSRRQKTT